MIELLWLFYIMLIAFVLAMVLVFVFVSWVKGTYVWKKHKIITYNPITKKYSYKEYSAGIVLGGSCDVSVNGKYIMYSGSGSFECWYRTKASGKSLFSIRKYLKQNFESKMKQRRKREETKSFLLKMGVPEEYFNR